MPQLPDITDSMVFQAVGDWLATVLPGGTPIVQAYDDRVPQPKPSGMAVMRMLGRTRLATNRTTYDDTHAMTQQATQLQLQVDLYGAEAGDWAQAVQSLFRSDLAVAFFRGEPGGVAPLYTDEPKQLPLVGGEEQWQRRWVVTLDLEIDPTVTSPQASADAVALGIFNVQATYPAT